MSDVCATPIQGGSNRGKPARGTWAGYNRHRKAGEDACADCLAKVNEDTKKRKSKARAKRRTKPSELMTGVPARRATEPMFRGSRLVTCKGCGRRGHVNMGLLGHRQWSVEECAECRG